MNFRTSLAAAWQRRRNGRWIGGCILAVALMLGAAAASADTVLAAPLKTYAGRIVYVDFWASWCGPCAQSFPWLNRMQAKYGDRLSIVAINLDTDSAAAKDFLSRHPAHFDVLYDPAGQLAERYRIGGMPSAVILGADGAVVHQHSGFRDADTGDYEAAIRSVVNTSSTSTGSAP